MTVIRLVRALIEWAVFNLSNDRTVRRWMR